MLPIRLSQCINRLNVWYLSLRSHHQESLCSGREALTERGRPRPRERLPKERSSEGWMERSGTLAEPSDNSMPPYRTQETDPFGSASFNYIGNVAIISGLPVPEMTTDYIRSGRVIPRIDIALVRTLAMVSTSIRRYFSTAWSSSRRIGVSW